MLKHSGIADVKKGFISSITERIGNTIKRHNSKKMLEEGKREREDSESRNTKKRKNKFKEDIHVTSAYGDISKQIERADEEELDSIREEIIESIREGKVSKTEGNGLLYNLNYKNKELSSPKPIVQNGQTVSKQGSGHGERG